MTLSPGERRAERLGGETERDSMTPETTTEETSVQTAEAQPSSAPASGSAPSYADGVRDGRASMRRQIRVLESEIQRIKARQPTIDECAAFLIRRAEESTEGARIILGIPKAEAQNKKVSDGGTH